MSNAPDRTDQAQQIVDLSAEMPPEELAELDAAIARSEEEYARGEGVPFDEVLDELDRDLAAA